MSYPMTDSRQDPAYYIDAADCMCDGDLQRHDVCDHCDEPGCLRADESGEWMDAECWALAHPGTVWGDEGALL